VDPSAKGNAALRHAKFNAHTTVVKLLLLADKRVDPSIDNNGVARWAVAEGHVGIVKLLLADERVGIAADNNFAMHLASENGQTEVVKLLLADKRVDPSANNNAALRCASKKGRAEVMKVLLTDKRVDPSVNENYAVRWASAEGLTNLVELLMKDDRVNPSARNQAALADASMYGHSEVVWRLLMDPRVRVTKSVVQAASLGGSQVPTGVFKVLLTTESQFWPRLVDNYMLCTTSEPLRETLGGLEVNSSLLLLLCVKRICTDVVAARVGDVLREVCEEWTRFQIVYKR
jgi:hypothetical protein